MGWIPDPRPPLTATDELEQEMLSTSPSPPQDESRRSTRKRRHSSRYNPNEYVLLIYGEELEFYSEVLEYERKEDWLETMQEEIMSLHKNHSYDLMKLPKSKRALKME